MYENAVKYLENLIQCVLFKAKMSCIPIHKCDLTTVKGTHLTCFVYITCKWDEVDLY